MTRKTLENFFCGRWAKMLHENSNRWRQMMQRDRVKQRGKQEMRARRGALRFFFGVDLDFGGDVAEHLDGDGVFAESLDGIG
jgi:hypothetical protein